MGHSTVCALEALSRLLSGPGVIDAAWETPFIHSFLYSFTHLLRRQREVDGAGSIPVSRCETQLPRKHVFSGMIDIRCPEGYSRQQARARLFGGTAGLRS